MGSDLVGIGTGVRSCYDEGKRTAETLTMDYHRGAGVEVNFPLPSLNSGSLRFPLFLLYDFQFPSFSSNWLAFYGKFS